MPVILSSWPIPQEGGCQHDRRRPERMVNVTTEARELLSEVLQDAREQQGIEDGEVGIRLALTTTPAQDSSSGQSRLDLVLDRPKEGDHVVEHGEDKVLIVDPTVSGILEGAVVEAVETPEGPRLNIKQ
jgi:Fe-S cluster assembly iron-binding protein IscA